jgi:hypothetical protein
MTAEDRVGYILSVDLAFGQMFEAGGGEHQRPAQRLHTIMVCRRRFAGKSQVAPRALTAREFCQSGGRAFIFC